MPSYSPGHSTPGPPSPPLRAPRLLDQVRERIRYDHYSPKTEKSYVQRMRRFVHFHGPRHPMAMMGGTEVSPLDAPGCEELRSTRLQ